MAENAKLLVKIVYDRLFIMDLNQCFAAVKRQIQVAERQAMRVPNSVQLIAVSKGQSSTAIAQAYVVGMRQFAENYLQEALTKIQQLAYLPALEWHFIGHIQSNKTKLIAENFAWVQSVDRLAIAQRLNKYRPLQLPPLNICLQVNVDNDAHKGGVAIADLPNLISEIGCLPRLRLRGLMTIPMRNHPQQVFVQMRQIYDDLLAQAINLDTLSMGMSADYEFAIAAGATQVRIGTALFGTRQQRSNE